MSVAASLYTAGFLTGFMAGVLVVWIALAIYEVCQLEDE